MKLLLLLLLLAAARLVAPTGAPGRARVVWVPVMKDPQMNRLDCRFTCMTFFHHPVRASSWGCKGGETAQTLHLNRLSTPPWPAAALQVYVPWPGAAIPFTNLMCSTIFSGRTFPGIYRLLYVYSPAGVPIQVPRCQVVINDAEAAAPVDRTWVGDGSPNLPFWCGCSLVDRRVVLPAPPSFAWVPLPADGSDPRCPAGKVSRLRLPGALLRSAPSALPFPAGVLCRPGTSTSAA